ncbi:MAG TPA: prolipoprotein diacylglyceryl transferase [Candidatus Acidoferrales bacterium]|nr:prolipoprotein diacylglyceryl transferase [Candidatus Acidoferrales bacterium]
MTPFIHIGPLTLASYGLCVGFAMLISYFVLAKDMGRRGIHAPADMMVAVPCIAGLIGAKLYHVFETPRELFADPKILISQYGFAWFGGFLGGLIAFVLLARHYRIPLLEIFDAASPAAALGYGIGRIGCLISGDGDYGIATSLPWGMSFPNGLVPTTEKVHPTPIYELIVAIFIFWWLWKLGGRQALLLQARTGKTAILRGSNRLATPEELALLQNTFQNPIKRRERRGFFPMKLRMWSRPPIGMVFAQYLILTGVARFLVEFIRINPRSFFGMTNAQTASLASVIIGVALMWHGREQAKRKVGSV